MDNSPNGPESLDPQLDAGPDAEEPDGLGGADADPGSSESAPHQGTAVRVIGSAIRGAGVDPGSMPARPELRRLRNAMNFWLLLFPLAALGVNLLIRILPSSVSIDELNRAIGTSLAPTAHGNLPWLPLLYFGPIGALGAFGLLMMVSGIYQFMTSRFPPILLAMVLPVVLLAVACASSGTVLLLGTKLPSDVYTTVLVILVYVLAVAVPVNWLLSAVLVRRLSTDRSGKMFNLGFCALLSLTVTGAGLCMLLGTDALEAAGRGDLKGAQTGQEETGSYFLMVVFFGLVAFFIVAGMWWYNQAVAWWKMSRTYSKAVEDVARSVILERNPDGTAVTLALAPGAGATLGMAIAVSRSIDYAAYLQAANGQFGWATSRRADPKISVWLEAGLRGGIRYLGARCADNGVKADADGYYAVYFRVVEGIAERFHKMLKAEERDPASDVIPADLLTAANLMAVEITEVFYRANMSSVVRQNTAGKPDRMRIFRVILPSTCGPCFSKDLWPIRPGSTLLLPASAGWFPLCPPWQLPERHGSI